MRPSRRLALLASVTTLAATGLVTGLVTGSPAAQAATTFGAGTPSFLASAAPADLNLPLTPLLSWNAPDQAGEPSVGVSWKTGAGLYMAGNNAIRLTFDNSTPKVTWADASPFFGSAQNLDPILVTQPHTGVTIAGGDTGACSAMFSTTDDGATWLPSVPCTGTIDHPTVGWSPSSADPSKTVFYYCQQYDLDNCATSTDDGLTWVPGLPLSFDCLSLHGHLKGSADGTAYLPSVNCYDAANNNLVGGLRTTDDGATWTGYTIPGAGTPADGFDPSVTTTPDNTVYEAWNNAGDYHPVVASSKDHGATWTAPTDLASTVSPPLVASTFPTLVAGDDGRVAYSFLGTSAGGTGVDPFTTGFHGVWYLYTSYTYDGGLTWTTVRDTPTPVQYGEIDAGGTTTQGQRNLLDFIDSSVTKDGRVLVAYADGCLADCEAAGTTGLPTAQADAEKLSTHAWASVAYQTGGRGLFAAYDTPEVPASPTLSGTAQLDANALSWTPPATDGGHPVTGYTVYRGTAAGAETPYATVGAVTTWTDDAVAAGTTYYYRVAATNSFGTGTPSGEVALTPYTTASAPVLTATPGKGTVALSWTTPYDGGKPITGWTIYRGTTAGGEVAVQTISSGTTYVDSGLSSRQTYWYQVAALTSAGTGARSNEASATPKKG